jgi:hypothetical protein
MDSPLSGFLSTAARVKIARELKSQLFEVQKRGWQKFTMVDECWFCWKSWLRRIWIFDESERPEKIKQTIDAKKSVVTVLASPRGFDAIDVLP